MNIQLASKIDCTGCMACQGACKHNAIRIVKDDNGFVYPSIDESRCKQCGACMQKCPILNYDKLNFRVPQKCYAAKIKNEDLTKGCTSGGIATALSLRTIQNGGVVYGAAFVPYYGVMHIRVDNEQGLERLKGSKYIESHVTLEIYQSIRADLKSRKEVLFIGTPCQVAAVEQMCDSEDLKTVSFICGGVGAKKSLYSHLTGLGVDNSRISRIIFRKGQTYCLEVFDERNIIFYQEKRENLWLKTYDEKGYIVRPSCLRCKFCRIERVGQLTIGDGWGIEDTDSKLRNDPNVSCVIIHDKAGKKQLLELESIVEDEVDLEVLGRYNICLTKHRHVYGWQLLERAMKVLFPIVGFNRAVPIVNAIGKIIRIPRRIGKILHMQDKI